MKKRKMKRAPVLRPQCYEHRVQVALEALTAALTGTELLTSFLVEQLGPQWRDQGPKAVAAAQNFRRACRWLRDIDRRG